ncbi:ABC transporter ATP-binding protein [Syntrophomonas wolfei]|uniref:ABC transporter ATP-binding protein n=1 Tax=Syntrophomonas wolfei TaxID=863 RepID=UPI00136673B8|nr:ABC transporter ATP-binding protein [Syntrophomonas wolfei]
MNSMYAVQIKELCKSYKNSSFTLQITDLSLEAGSIFGLLGPNGAGKTSLLQLLMDIVRPDRGYIEILGHRPFEREKLQAKISYMPENKNLYHNMTVKKMLDYASGIIPGWDNDKALELKNIFPLEGKKRISTLSYGERTQLYAILTFARSAELFILDEPTRGLDPIMQEQMLQLIKEKSWQGKTIIFSSHQLGEIEESVDTLAMLRKGHMVLNGNLDDLKSELFLLKLGKSELSAIPPSTLDIVATHHQHKQSLILCQGGMESRQKLQADFAFLNPENVNIKDIFLLLMENGGEEE